MSGFDAREFYQFTLALKINSKEYGMLSLGANPLTTQTYLLEHLERGFDDGIHEFVVLKARQLGISTLLLALDLYWINKFTGLNGALVTHTDKARDQFRTTLELYRHGLDEDWQREVMDDNRNQLVLSNGSRLAFEVAGTKAKSGGSTLGRSGALTFCHSCVTPDTPVILENGWIKPIEDVRIGDKVLTHTGAEARVIDVLGQPNDKGDLIKITPWLGQSLCFTGEHTLPTSRGIIEVKEVRPSDYLVMPVRTITHAPVAQQLPESTHRFGYGSGCGMSVEINQELGFFVGYYLAEGCITRQVTTGLPCAISFARHRNEKRFADRAIKAVIKYTSGHRKTVDRKGCLTSTDTIYCSALSRWIDTTFGSLERKCIPDIVFTWGESFCTGLLSGLLCGDGSKGDRIIGDAARGDGSRGGGKLFNQIVLPTTRSSIATQARDLAASLGYGWASMSFKDAGNHYGRNCKPCWRLTWNGEAAAKLRVLMGEKPIDTKFASATKYLIQDQSVWLKIRKIERGIKADTIYDLSVDHDDHTFRTPYMSIGNTETAFYGDADGIDSLRSSFAKHNPNRFFIFESTANGFSHFEEMWREAKASSTKRAIFIGWHAHSFYRLPEDGALYARYWGKSGRLTSEERMLIRDVKTLYGEDIDNAQVAWYRYMQAEEITDESRIRAEFPWTEDMAFVATGSAFFRTLSITQALKQCRVATPPDLYRIETGANFSNTRLINAKQVNATLWVWAAPVATAYYVLGCDPAYASSEDADFSVVTVWRVWYNRIEQVAEFADRDISSHAVAWVMAFLAGYFGRCVTNLEVYGPGMQVLAEIQNLRRQGNSKWEGDQGENVRKVTKYMRQYLYRRLDSFSKASNIHTKTNYDIKERMMNGLRDNFERGILVVRSAALVEEMKSVVRDGGSAPAAPGGKNDDRVVGAALAVMCWNDQMRTQLLAERVIWAEDEKTGQAIPEPRNRVESIVQNYMASIGLGPASGVPAPPKKVFRGKKTWREKVAEQRARGL